MSQDADPEEMDLEIGPARFVLRVFPDPSGLRGQVFRGEEKVAGVQLYHSTDRDALVQLARRDPAVIRAAGADQGSSPGRQSR